MTWWWYALLFVAIEGPMFLLCWLLWDIVRRPSR